MYFISCKKRQLSTAVKIGGNRGEEDYKGINRGWISCWCVKRERERESKVEERRERRWGGGYVKALSFHFSPQSPNSSGGRRRVEAEGAPSSHHPATTLSHTSKCVFVINISRFFYRFYYSALSYYRLMTCFVVLIRLCSRYVFF